MQLPEKVERKLQELPDKPGCYLMRDAFGRIIYVGKAASLSRRVRSYFRRATLRSANPKLRGLIRSVADLDVIVLRSEAEAILTEGRLIKDYRPRYNTSFRDDKRFLLLKVDLRRPFPRFQTARFQRADGAEYFGPFPSSGATRATLEFVEKKFGLRRCAPARPGPYDHRHCIDDIVRYCAAPCAGKITETGYRERVAQVCALLRGEDPARLAQIKTAMQEAAAQRDFEKAAMLRDTLQTLRLAGRRAHAVRTPALGAAQIQEGLRALKDLIGLRDLPRQIEAIDVSCISGTLAVGSLVCARDGVPRPERYRRFRIRTAAGTDDPGMMAEVVRRRFRRLLAEGKPAPDLVMVDGGLTQLRAARRVLAELGLGHLPVIGLAKRYEEIYRDDPRLPDPLRLPEHSPALRILQRIRDEAHRFALAYHRRLRAKRIRESVLDDIPGVGPARKQRLLRQFGSVERLARADESQIMAQIPGVGPALARAIRAALSGWTSAI